MIFVFTLFLAGFFAGILGGLLGIGGGFIIVPLLTLVFKYPVHIAVATSLITIVANSSNITGANVVAGYTNIKFGLFLETTTVLPAILGSLISVSLNEKVIMIIFSVVLIGIAALYYLRRNIYDTYIEDEKLKGFFSSSFYDVNAGKEIKYRPSKIFFTGAVSAFAGLLSGMLGIGGGVIKVPAMNVISKLPIKAATSTSNFMIGITAAAGSIVYFNSHLIDPLVTALMIVGVSFGSKFAAKRFKTIQDKKIKMLFMIFLIVVAIQMFIKGIM